MEAITSAILGALVAGATAAASETASQAVKDAYQGLKQVLVDGYKLASASLLEKRPSSVAYQEAVKDELKDHPDLADDKAVLEKAMALRDALSRERADKLTALGIDIEVVKAGGNLIAEHIRGGIKGREWSASGDVTFSRVEPVEASGKE